jgi:hypothetical protein
LPIAAGLATLENLAGCCVGGGEQHVNEVRSLLRTVRLHTPPKEPWTIQVLFVPSGSTDTQVLEWAAGVLDPASLAELREILEREA